MDAPRKPHKRAARLFASYSREDRRLVDPVVKLLRSTRAPVFYDIDSIEPGERWRARLDEALAGATTVLVFWSVGAARSEWVMREWSAAVAVNKEIIPVVLDSTPLPLPLCEYQWIDLRGLLSVDVQIDAESADVAVQFSMQENEQAVVEEHISCLLARVDDPMVEPIHHKLTRRIKRALRTRAAKLKS